MKPLHPVWALRPSSAPPPAPPAAQPEASAGVAALRPRPWSRWTRQLILRLLRGRRPELLCVYGAGVAEPGDPLGVYLLRPRSPCGVSCTVCSRSLRPPPTGPASCETRVPSAHACPSLPPPLTARGARSLLGLSSHPFQGPAGGQRGSEAAGVTCTSLGGRENAERGRRPEEEPRGRPVATAGARPVGIHHTADEAGQAPDREAGRLSVKSARRGKGRRDPRSPVDR